MRRSGRQGESLRIWPCGEAVEVPAGQRMSMTLADGTSCVSRRFRGIEYPCSSSPKPGGGSSLTGEALFEVTPRRAATPSWWRPIRFGVEVLGHDLRRPMPTTAGTVHDDARRGQGARHESARRDREQWVLHSSRVGVRSSATGWCAARGPILDALCWTEVSCSIGRVGFDEWMAHFENAYASPSYSTVPTLLDRLRQRVRFASRRVSISL